MNFDEDQNADIRSRFRFDIASKEWSKTRGGIRPGSIPKRQLEFSGMALPARTVRNKLRTHYSNLGNPFLKATHTN